MQWDLTFTQDNSKVTTDLEVNSWLTDMVQWELRIRYNTSISGRYDHFLTLLQQRDESLFISHTEELLSSQQATLRQGFLSTPELGEMHGKPVAVKGVACAGTRLSCPSQGTRNTHSAVHPSVVPIRSPVPGSCVSWLTAAEAATVQCGKDASSKILGSKEVFQKLLSWKTPLTSCLGT